MLTESYRFELTRVMWTHQWGAMYHHLTAIHNHPTPVSDSPFRFADLPAEIRNSIYRLVVHNPKHITIRQFKPPAIAQVSRQLRSEALSLFFDINVFVAEVKASYMLTYENGGYHAGVFIPPDHKKYKQVGTLQLRRAMVSLFKLAGSNVGRIKNLDICILSADGSFMGGPGKTYFDAVVSVRGKAVSPKAKVRTHVRGPREVAGQRRRTEMSHLAELRYIADQAQTCIKSLLADPQFNGLSIAQLKKVANSFRVQPRVPGRVMKFREQRVEYHSVGNLP